MTNEPNKSHDKYHCTCNNSPPQQEFLETMTGLLNAIEIGIRIGAVRPDFLLDAQMAKAGAAIAKARGQQ